MYVKVLNQPPYQKFCGWGVKVGGSQKKRAKNEKVFKEDLKKNILTQGFFREAKKGQDTNWRIHNDSIIDNQQPDRAIVLFANLFRLV